MKAGVASRCINPGQKVWMAGYGRQPEPTDTAYQDLKAKALVLDDGRTRVAVVTCDLLNFDEENVARFRGAIRCRTGIPEDHILLCPSHTHTAPGTCRIDVKDDGDISEEYLQDLEGWFGEVTARALDGLEEARLGFGTARCDVGINRRLRVDGRVEMRPNPDGPVDREVGILKVCGRDGGLRGALMSCACHPTTYYSTEMGGDYAGFAQDALERDMPGVVALFAQGCGGDVKPRSIGEDGRFRADRREAAEALGGDLARSVRTALDRGVSPVEGRLSVAETSVSLPIEPPPTREIAREALTSTSWWVVRWGGRCCGGWTPGRRWRRTSRSGSRRFASGISPSWPWGPRCSRRRGSRSAAGWPPGGP